MQAAPELDGRVKVVDSLGPAAAQERRGNTTNPAAAPVKVDLENVLLNDVPG